MELKKATRVGIRPLIGMYGESGSGKTMSALLLARGFVGKDGIIGLVDSESGRGSLYADVIPGGYEVLDLAAPFSPAHYMESVNFVAKHAAIGVLDSGSHEWEGVGGVNDMAADEEHRGMKGLGVWRKPKMEHAKFMLTLLQSPIPWIVCLRAKYKSHQKKRYDEAKGKEVTEIVRDDFLSPQQAEDFLYEMTAHLIINPENHHARPTKCSHPALLPCFPKDGLIEIKHGELLRQWCDAPTMRAAISERPELVKKLWALTENNHQGDKKKLEQWLWDEGYISPDNETLEKLTEARLKEVIAKVEAKGRAT